MPRDQKFLQDLEEQKRTKYKINGTATTAIEKSNPNLPAKSRRDIRSATLSEVLFWDNFDSISYVMPTSRPVPSPVPSATVPYSYTVHWCRTVLYSRSRHHELAPPPAYS